MNINTTFWLLSFILLKIFSASATADKLIVCYYRSDIFLRSGNLKYSPTNIDPNLCTHLMYTYDVQLQLPSYEIEQAVIGDFVRLKTYNTKLKILVSYSSGGNPSIFSSLVEKPERRNAYVKTAIQFVRLNGFDGLEVDWEDPTYGDGSRPEDRINYARFVQEIREELDRESLQSGQERLLLTITISGKPDIIDQGYDVPKLNEHVDWFNVKAYKYHDSSESITNHHAPFILKNKDKSKLSFEYSAKYLRNIGASDKKLVLGVPTFGISYTLSNPIYENTIGSPVDGPGKPGRDTGVAGFLAYFEICQLINNDNWTVVNNDDAYIFKGNQWISFDDETTVYAKGVYVAVHGLGGLMFWSIDTDDSECKCSDLSYPLIGAGKEGLSVVYPLPTKRMKTRTGVNSTVTTCKTTTTINQPTEPTEQTTQLQPTMRNDNYDDDINFYKSNESYDNDSLNKLHVQRASRLINELFELVEKAGGADQFRKLVDSIPSEQLKTKININKLFRDDISNQNTDLKKFNPPAINGDRSTGYRFALQRKYEDGTLFVFAM